MNPRNTLRLIWIALACVAIAAVSIGTWDAFHVVWSGEAQSASLPTSVSDLFGTFRVTDYTLLRGLGDEARAKAHAHSAITIAPAGYSDTSGLTLLYRGVILKPAYAIIRYGSDPGDQPVPDDATALSEYWGFGINRTTIPVLYVANAMGVEQTSLEIIDRDTLWFLDGQFIYQLRRVDATSTYVPVSDTYLSNTD